MIIINIHDIYDNHIEDGNPNPDPTYQQTKEENAKSIYLTKNNYLGINKTYSTLDIIQVGNQTEIPFLDEQKAVEIFRLIKDNVLRSTNGYKINIESQFKRDQNAGAFKVRFEIAKQSISTTEIYEEP